MSSFSSLPDEIAENILARISRWKHPKLSLVSKRFLSLLSSPELYKTRSHIGTTEPCLYICVKRSKHQPSNWYTLWMKPVDETLTLTDDDDDDIGEDFSLVPIPSYSQSHRFPYYSTVAVGSEIYSIGGPYRAPPSSAVRILDCRSHTWRDGPSMMVARACAYAFLLDEKIYVMGGCEEDGESLGWMEVLDIKTQTWRPLPSHGAAEFCSKWRVMNVHKGKIYAISEMEDYAYNLKEGTWEVVETHESAGWIDAWCEIEDVMYCYTNSGYCMCFDSETRKWIEVKGSDIQSLREPRTIGLAWGCVVEMQNHGGKLLVVWVPTPRFEERNATRKRRIWCTKIALEKRHGGEVWGKMEWVNTFLTDAKSYSILSCVAASI